MCDEDVEVFMSTVRLVLTEVVSGVVILAGGVRISTFSWPVSSGFVGAEAVFSVTALDISPVLLDKPVSSRGILALFVVDVLKEWVAEPSIVPFWLSSSIVWSVVEIEVCFMTVSVLNRWVDVVVEVLVKELSRVFLSDRTDVFDVTVEDVMPVFFRAPELFVSAVSAFPVEVIASLVEFLDTWESLCGILVFSSVDIGKNFVVRLVVEALLMRSIFVVCVAAVDKR